MIYDAPQNPFLPIALPPRSEKKNPRKNPEPPLKKNQLSDAIVFFSFFDGGRGGGMCKQN